MIANVAINGIARLIIVSLLARSLAPPQFNITTRTPLYQGRYLSWAAPKLTKDGTKRDKYKRAKSG